MGSGCEITTLPHLTPVV